MKILVTNYTFDASAKTITFADINPIDLEKVLLITNVTDNIIIYNFAKIGKGGTAATNIMTLDFDTTSMSDTDELQIYYDDPTATQSVSGTITADVDVSTLAKESGGNLEAIEGNTDNIPVDPATVTKQDAIIAAIQTLLTDSDLRATPVPVSATDLDIRNLSSATDSVTALGNVASGAIDSGNPVKVAGRYNSSAPTFTNGQRADLQSDVNGNLFDRETYMPTAEDNANGVIAVAKKPVISSTYSTLPFGTFGTDIDIAVKTSPGLIFSLSANNANANARYLQIFNKASAPALNDVPIHSWLMPTGTQILIGSDFFGSNGAYCSTGVAVGVSTTNATFTAATAADHNVNGMYA